MADNKKKLHKETRGQFVGEYSKAHCEIDQTTSWPEGLHEASRFLPCLRRPVRRTDSVDDIERYKLYFSLARKNQRNQLTWKQYCDILLDELRNSDLLIPLKKLSIQSSCTPVISKSSTNTAAASSVTSLIKLFEKPTPKKGPFIDYDADVESISSVDVGDVKFHSPSKYALKLPNQSPCSTPVKLEASKFTQVSKYDLKRLLEKQASQKRPFLDIDADFRNAEFQTPSKNVLKKMCTEIRTLAQKTCKTVERMTTNKYCSTCGDIIRSTTVHKKCSKQRIEEKGCSKPVTNGLLSTANPVINRRLSFRSPTIKSNNVYLLDSRFKNLQQKPLFKLQ